MDYEYYYDNAKTKYYNACSEITNCKNYADELNIQKQNMVNSINDLEAVLVKYRDAYEKVITALGYEETFNSELQEISDDITTTADNYSSMVISSTVTSKNLTDIFSDEMSQEKLSLSNVLELLKSTKTNLSNAIDTLESEIQASKDAVEAFKTSISSNQSSLEEWQTSKKNASYDMEYYKRKMEAAV